MATSASRFKARLFLENMEVPFQKVTLNCQAGLPVVAQLDLVPCDVIKYIRPKTQVLLYIVDYLNFGDYEPRLAFEGEVCGKVRQKMQNSRGFSIIAADYSEYWNEIKAYFYNTNFLVGKLQDLVQGEPPPAILSKAASVSTITGGATINSYMLTRLLQDTKKYNLVTAIANICSSVASCNAFYSLAFDRLRISDRIKVNTSGNLTQLLNELNIDEFLSGYTGREGGFVSLRQMLLNVMALVFHDFISVPFPSVVPATFGGRKSGTTIGNFLFVPDSFAFAPPKCNILFPNQVVGYNWQEDFRDAPTRFAFRASPPQFISNQTNIVTYPMQYYPTSFRNYMTGKSQITDTQFKSQLGPSTVIAGKNGQTYASLKYGAAAGSAVTSTLATKLREQDFLTNEESIKGIFFENETFPPGIQSLSTKSSQQSRWTFTDNVGAYLFTKKRAQAANGTAELLFNPFLVPGFNGMFVDDSDADQSFIAKIQTLTHTISENSASTSAGLGMCRELEEIDLANGGSSEPPLPSWFDTSIFGSVNQTAYQAELAYLKQIGYITAQEYTDRLKVTGVVTFPNLSSFYQDIIGVGAATGFTDSNGKKSPIVTLRGLGIYLANAYANVRDDEVSRDKFVWNFIRRPVATATQSFNFLGIQPKATGDSVLILTSNQPASAAQTEFSGATSVATSAFSLPSEFAVLQAVTSGARAGRFDGNGFGDYQQLQIRRSIISKYVALLKTRGGADGKAFRG